MLNKFILLFRNKVKEGIISPKVIKKYQADPDFPYLVSFPRTGSHWFRMMLELYTDRPLLVRSFYDHDSNKYLLLHTHDMNLAEKRKNVIYLYRYPTDVIYSQIQYYQQSHRNNFFVHFWSSQYALHLSHWIYKESYTEKKTIISYEGLKNNIEGEFEKVCKHFSIDFDADKLKEISQKITKDYVAQKTTYDTQIINRGNEYYNHRRLFMKDYDDSVMDVLKQVSESVLGDEERLARLFKY